jgi:hypothetical protein
LRYFAEKRFVRRELPDLVDEVYPDHREIVLVRDLRDVFASRVAFHRRLGVWPDDLDAADAAAKAVAIRRRGEDVLDRLDVLGDRALTVRYEDLVAAPEAGVARIMAFLDLDHPADAVVEAIGSEYSGHVTAASPAESVQRWRRDLAGPVAEAVDAEVEMVNRRLGYE